MIIKVNNRSVAFHSTTVTHEELRELAGIPENTPCSILFTEPGEPDTKLKALPQGEFLFTHDGMKFRVTALHSAWRTDEGLWLKDGRDSMDDWMPELAEFTSDLNEAYVGVLYDTELSRIEENLTPVPAEATIKVELKVDLETFL